MVLYNESGDQMVPQGVNYVSGSSGGTVIETGVAKSLPDFDSLLQGLSAPEAVKRDVEPDPTGTVTSLDALQLQTLTDLESTMTDEIGFYDDSIRFKQEYGIKEKYLTGSDLTLPPPPSEEEQRQSQVVMDEVQREINYACSMLGIPLDPYMWSLQQAQQWVMWTLEQFKLPLEHQEHFLLDGTSLCMLAEDDFKMRSHIVGPYLYAQLEIWKNARNLLGAPMDDYTLTDLDSIQRPMATYPQPVQQMPIHAIPTSVIMPTPTLSPTPSTDSMDSNNSSLGGSWGALPQDHHMTPERRPATLERPTPVTPRPHYPHMRQNTIHLWQFLKELLLEPHAYSSCIRWLDSTKGIFKIEDSSRVAKLWGQRKNRPAMNYDKLSRSIRQYYKKGIIKKTEHSKRLVYQFCPQYML